MTLPDVALLLGAGGVAGVLNAVAGGGSFVTFPALMAAGLAPVSANATNTLALFPGQIASAWAYRKDVPGISGLKLRALSVASVAGGAAGGLLLLATPERLFVALLPWLVGFATAVFGWGAFLRRGDAGRARLNDRALITMQAVIAVYGGYFGGGVGFIMLAALTLYGLTDIHAMNGAKILFAMLMNAAAALILAFSPVLAWGPGALVCLGALVGGWAGPSLARSVPPAWVKGFVVLLGSVLTLWFSLR